MTIIDHAIERFREKFRSVKGSPGGRVLLRDEDGNIVGSRRAFIEDYEQYMVKEISRTRTDFAQEVEEKVIGENDDRGTPNSTQQMGGRVYEGAYYRNKLREQQRQALHHLIGEKQETPC